MGGQERRERVNRMPFCRFRITEMQALGELLGLASQFYDFFSAPG